MGKAPFWFWLLLVAILAGIILLVVLVVRRGLSLTKGLAIASLVFVIGLFFIPNQAVQANGIYLVAILALGWVGYVIWRLMEKGWSVPPTKSQMDKVMLAFSTAFPNAQIKAAIPATVVEFPSLPSRRTVSRGMLILAEDAIYLYGPKGNTSRVPAADIAAMPIVSSQEREAPGAPSVIIASKSGAFEWVAISETGQEGAELLAKWGEHLYAR